MDTTIGRQEWEAETDERDGEGVVTVNSINSWLNLISVTPSKTFLFLFSSWRLLLNRILQSPGC